MRRSLRLKVALAFSVLAILLLISQTLGVKALVESQVEGFITALITDDMTALLRSYRADSALVPPLDARLDGSVSEAGQARVTLPGAVVTLSPGIHELLIDGREIHVYVASLNGKRIYRVYDFSAYEQHFREMSGMLIAGTGIFALLFVWLAYGLSGLLVRQIASFGRQLKALQLGAAGEINPGRYDEAEVVELVSVFNDFHHRMAQMVEREQEFAANLSHELRTPLTTIKTSCELLQQDAAVSLKSWERLRQIEFAADHMSMLVSALLQLAREESSVDTGAVCLADVVKDVLDPFAGTLAANAIRVEIRLESDLRVVANRPALAIVLSNLVDNAVRHTRQGGLCFTYRGGSLRIEDTGIGIPPEALTHVFERFYRAPPGNVDRGFGIGLAIVKRICDRYHWAIEIDSAVGRGTCVALGIPPVG